MNDPVKIARMAATSYFKPSDIGYDEAMDICLPVVIEMLADGCDLQAMLRACNLDLQAEARRKRKFYGRLAHDASRYHPGFARYWHGRPVHAASFADDLIEAVAIVQVFWALPAHYREVLLREAWDYDRHLHYRSEVRRARQAAWALWYDHETPPTARVRRAHYSRREAA